MTEGGDAGRSTAAQIVAADLALATAFLFVVNGAALSISWPLRALAVIPATGFALCGLGLLRLRRRSVDSSRAFRTLGVLLAVRYGAWVCAIVALSSGPSGLGAALYLLCILGHLPFAGVTVALCGHARRHGLLLLGEWLLLASFVGYVILARHIP